MTPRVQMALGAAAGCLWAVGIVALGVAAIDVPVFALLPTLGLAFIGPGLVISALVLAISLRRFADDLLADGDAPRPFSSADIELRVLGNTVEQTVLALCLWPATAYLATDEGPGLVTALGWAFVPARVAYWLGYRIAPPLRMFGFSATFFATLFAFVWALWAAYGFALGAAGGA